MKIQRPDEAEIRVSHHNLYKGMSQKSLAAASGVSSTILSRRLDHNESIVKNPIYEIVMEMIGAVESGQPSIGKGVFRMVYDYAVELGLVDGEPLDIIKTVTQRLRKIGPDDIQKMSVSERLEIVADAAALEEEAGRVKNDVNEARLTVAEKNTNARAFLQPRIERTGSR